MSTTPAQCIYCGRFFNPRRGEGDHILSVRLFGLFEGDKTFRGVCTRCNNSLGRLEQMLIHSTHLGYFRRLAQPKLGRAKRGTASLRQKGYGGSKPPVFIADVDGHKRLVRLSDTNPDTCVPVDELVVVDDNGNEHHIQLFRGMSADDLRAKIAKLGVTHKGEYGLSCSDDAVDEFTTLLKTVVALARIEELPSTEAGVHRVRVRGEFQFTADYYRAIAKIALHYYLAYNERGFRGNEPYFRELRRFIRHGVGNHEQFFRSAGGTFVTRFGETQSGTAVLPGQWCHVLAVSELNNTIAVCLRLYLGPKHLPQPDYITLAEIRIAIVLPHRAWGHVYQIEPGRKDRYAGRVVTPTISRLR
jgi:hypothetical protein